LIVKYPTPFNMVIHLSKTESSWVYLN
jgi:hypothetical protein